MSKQSSQYIPAARRVWESHEDFAERLEDLDELEVSNALMEEAEADSFNEVEADGVSSKEVGTSNADALPTKYKFKSLRFEENGSQPTSMMNKNGSTSKAKVPLLHCSKIRHTTKNCRWYRIEPGEPLPTLPAEMLEIGDLIIQGEACRMAVQGRQGIKWIYVRDGESYPGCSLPDHVLTLRSGKPPAWVTQRVRSKKPNK